MLRTPRLILRPWKDSDLPPFAAMNADPRVREYFPSTLTREQSDASVEGFRAHIDRHGFGFFAAELIEDAAFIGLIGAEILSFAIPGVPDRTVEIGWRLAYPYWGRGLATEGARAVLDYCFQTLRLPEVVAFTVPANLPSRRVMERLGMVHHPELDFNHPGIPPGHPLRRHVLYMCSNQQ